MNKLKNMFIPAILILVFCFLFSGETFAEAKFSLPKVGIDIEPAQGPTEIPGSLQVVILLTVLSLAPAILIMMTSFTRIIIILSFLRNALGTQQMPPNQVLIGLALFLTFFIMAPVGAEVNSKAIQPYSEGKISQEVALKKAMQPVREFMLNQTREKDLALFYKLSEKSKPESVEDIPNTIVIPSFIISELKTAFQIGFIIFIPFLIIDMVVSSTLMSMGMLMLPPIMISLPFKILLFIMVDGWNLITQSIISTFK